MPFDFSLEEKPSTPVIQRDIDSEKHNQIVQKLCDKRKVLEQSLKDESLSASDRENSALHLIDLKSSMTVFGISEIAYQAYLQKLPE